MSCSVIQRFDGVLEEMYRLREKHSGKAFSLSTATLEAGKTGYLESSFLACQAKGKSNSRYILILGDATGSSAGLACYYTMRDVKYVLDTYVS